MPVEIVIGILSVPTAIMRLESIVRPPHAGVGTGHNDPLPGESKRPDFRCVNVIDSGFHNRRCARSGTSVFHRSALWEFIMDQRIAFYPRHLWPSCQGFG